MKTPCKATVLVFAALLFVASAPASAQTDRVRTKSGNVSGQVTAMTPVGVTVTRGSTEKQVSLVDIRAVQFDGEPSELRQARLNYRNGAYKTAIEKLGKVDASEIDNPFITADIVFYTAVSQARLALLGEGTIADAGRKVNQFLTQNRKSYHFLEATEVLGDLFVAAKRYDQAEERYKTIAKAPFPAYKIRAGVLLGELLQARSEHAAAIDQFDQVLAIDDSSSGAATQKLRARLGRAVSLSSTGKLDEGVELVQAVIKDSDPESRQLNAMAYNALGNCYREAGKAKDAAFAYLHVDLLYESAPEQHAEALYHLGSVLEAIGKSEQARDARQRLKQKYASSQWAQK